jgi:hypothetical protein
MERRTAYRRTTRFILFGMAVLAGLAWARWVSPISSWWPVIFGLFAFFNFRKARLFSVYAVVLFIFTIGWFSWPARWLLTYLLDIAGLISCIPNMRFSVSIGTSVMVVLYTIILSYILIWWHKNIKSSKITDVNEQNVVE